VATLGKGDFFGEISLLLGEPPVADVVAQGSVRALQLAGPELRDFLLAYPQVMYRMLQAVSRQLTHYAYHVGQIVFLARHLVGAGWKTLSVPKGHSELFNEAPRAYLAGFPKHLKTCHRVWI
jgi:hypothetical protein